MKRRTFLAASAAGIAAPIILPSSVFGQNAPSERINIGCIGVNGMGRLNMQNFLRHDTCRITAVCDVDQAILDQAAQMVNDAYGNQDCKKFKDYRELLQEDGIDAVMIATPDHWHAAIAIEAARAKKDIYGEKPITHTHAEGVKLVKAVNDNECIWQTGSWQRSQWPWRQAVALVRNGHLGEVQHIEVGLPSGDAFPPDPGEFQPPENVDYEMWCGPSPVLPFHPQRFHFHWRWNYAYGGGQLLDWIGHHNDIAHWAMDVELSGPTRVETVQFDVPKEREVWDASFRYEAFCEYPSGITTRLTNRTRQGVTFLGSDGWLFISRGDFQASNPEWTQESFNPGDAEVYVSNDHWRNFLDCVKSRKKTITPAEVAHRSITPGHLALISAKLQKPIEWDPEKETIIGNDEASKLLNQQGDQMPWLPWRKEWAGPLLEG